MNINLPKVLKTSLLIFALLISYSDLSAVYAQSENTPTVNQKESISLRVSVWDKKASTFVSSLNKEDFLIKDGKREIEIDSFSNESEPVSMGILLDLSGSMLFERNSKRNDQTLAFYTKNIKDFIGSSNENNEVFLFTFAEDATLVSSKTQDQTALFDSLNNIELPSKTGNSNIFETIDRSLQLMEQAKFERKVLVIVSDGIHNSDNFSRYTRLMNDVKKNHNLAVFLISPILLPTHSGPAINRNNALPVLFSMPHNKLASIIRSSGGQSYFPRNTEEFESSFRLISSRLKSEYSIGLVSSEKFPGGYRKLNVVLRSKQNNKDTELLSASGYYKR